MKLDISDIDKDKLFFTSDPHFFHKNIIKYCDRPWDNPTDMNEDLIYNWNEIIPKDGIVFMLGDFAMGANKRQIEKVLGQLNGKKHLIIGNHDRDVLKGYVKTMWESVNDLVKITVTDDEVDNGHQPIILCHYPMITWDGAHRGSWQLFGHVHGGLSNKGVIKHGPSQMDVGVDSHEYYPISYEDVKVQITKQNLKK